MNYFLNILIILLIIFSISPTHIILNALSPSGKQHFNQERVNKHLGLYSLTTCKIRNRGGSTRKTLFQSLSSGLPGRLTPSPAQTGTAWSPQQPESGVPGLRCILNPGWRLLEHSGLGLCLCQEVPCIICFQVPSWLCFSVPLDQHTYAKHLEWDQVPSSPVFSLKPAKPRNAWKVTLLSADFGLALTDSSFTAASGRRRRGTSDRMTWRETLSVVFWDFTVFQQVRAYMEVQGSSSLLQPTLTIRPGMVKMAPRFFLRNSPWLPSWVWDSFFGNWHSWRLSTHTLVWRLPNSSEPSHSSQAGPIVCLDLCTANVSLRLIVQAPGEEHRPCHTAPHSLQPSGMQQDSWNPKWHPPLKLYILLANGLLIIPQWLVGAAVSSLSS